MENMNRNQKIDVDNNKENKTIVRCNFFNRLRNFDIEGWWNKNVMLFENQQNI